MPLPPIHVQLTKFEQIEILRSEIEARDEELKQIERTIKQALFEMERQRYLQSIHALFHQLPAPEHAAELDQLNATREAIGEALQVMQAGLAALESETAGQSAPASRNPGLAAKQPGAAVSGPRRARFDSFDDFRASKGGGN